MAKDGNNYFGIFTYDFPIIFLFIFMGQCFRGRPNLERRNILKRRVPGNDRDPSDQFLKLLNMESISFKKHPAGAPMGGNRGK